MIVEMIHLSGGIVEWAAESVEVGTILGRCKIQPSDALSRIDNQVSKFVLLRSWKCLAVQESVDGLALQE